MRQLFVYLMAALCAAALLAAGCAQSAPPPAPTKAPAAQPAAAPTKAPEATKPAAPTAAPAAPTAAPAPKVQWPEKGKPVTVIVPFNAGGGTDLIARLVSAELEKELGAPFQVVNKAGAGSQVGMTELSLAKPDGYTLGVVSIPTISTSYLDAQRKATYTRKSFQTVSLMAVDPLPLSVKIDGPYKTVKDLIDAAKANPEKVKLGDSGPLAVLNLNAVGLQKLAGVKFAFVHFDGGGPALTALLGGHVDVTVNSSAEAIPKFKAGEIRSLGIFDTETSKQLPGVPTMASQGYPVKMLSSLILHAPAGTPAEVVDILNKAVKKALETPEVIAKVENLGMRPSPMTPAQTATLWEDAEKEIKPIVDEDVASRK